MVRNRYITHYNVYIDPHFFLGRNIGYLMRSLAHPSLKNGKNRIFKSMHHTNYNRNKISKNEVDSLVLYYLNNWCVYLRKRGPTLRELWGFKVVCSPPPQKGVKTSYIDTLYDYAYIKRSTCFMSSGSCTVWKGQKQLVHCVTLHCLHHSTCFMLFMTSHPQSCLAGSFWLLHLFDGMWLLRNTIKRQPGRWITTGIRGT